MFDSLNKIKNLPKSTEIYCGHEYTLQNARFCIENDPKNLKLKKKFSRLRKKLRKIYQQFQLF